MMSSAIQCQHYRNGQLREEVPLRKGRRHGIVRTWHKNGVLASEEPYRDGLFHGVCRQWNESGMLLGKCRLVHGTGIQRAWLFLEMWRCTKARKARDAPWRQAEVDQWYERYWKILRAGRRANPLTAEQKVKKRRKQSKEQNLLDRLESYDQCILAFLADLELPFTNNEAERPLRMMKVRVKVSGCFRTLIGARRHARIRSYISTVRKHGLPVLEQLRRALDGSPFLPEAPKTT